MLNKTLRIFPVSDLSLLSLPALGSVRSLQVILLRSLHHILERLQSFPLKTHFRYIQVTFEGFTV